MRPTSIVFFIVFVFSKSAQSALIGFDRNPITGTSIGAQATYNATLPSSPVPGPIVDAYKPIGVKFDGGVVLSYDRYGGPADIRAPRGSFLASPPNLLASSDYFSLADGTLLNGDLSATFKYNVKSANVSLRNGNVSGDFRLDAIYDNEIVDSDTVSAGSFLTLTQDALLSVRAEKIDSLRISSFQPNGQKNFGIDSVEFFPVSFGDALHASFALARAATAKDERSQAFLQRNFESAEEAAESAGNAPTIKEIGSFIADRAFNLIDIISYKLNGAILPFIIVPCESPALIGTGNCGIGSQYTVDASIFDVRAFELLVRYMGDNAISEFANVGDVFYFVNEYGEQGTIGRVEINSLINEEEMLLEFSTITNETVVPLPPTALFLLSALSGLLALKVRFGQRSSRQ